MLEQDKIYDNLNEREGKLGCRKGPVLSIKEFPQRLAKVVC